MKTDDLWIQQADGWWLRDFTKLPDTRGMNTRALRGYWQTAAYETKEFRGVLLLSNPSQAAPDLRIPLPVTGRFAIAIGMVVNYSDKVLIKLERDRCWRKLAHTPTPPATQTIEECWWRDVDLVKGDVLLLRQDDAMKRRAGIGFVRLYPATAPTKPEIPLLITADGFPGNMGPIPLDDMLEEELQFDDTHVTDILHGTDINGSAQYMTKLPAHRYPVERAAEEEMTSHEYYPWVVDQMRKFEREGRCPLRDSVEAAHSIGRKLYAYYRMAITRLYAPYRGLFFNDFYDEHPEWRCVDFDGTPITRLSIAYPEVRQYFLEHFRETVEFGADGVCLVFNRGWPLILFEEPVAQEFKRKTGKDMHSVSQDDPALRQVRAEFVNSFMRDIRRTVTEAGGRRETKIVALTLAQPSINKHFAMDCDTWAKEGLVDVLCPYPYGMTAVPTLINAPDWVPVVRGTNTKLCPILNRMTYEPAGIFETPKAMLDRAEQWLKDGVDGFSFWDLDGYIAQPAFRRFAYNLGSKEGRARLRQFVEAGPIYHNLKMVDGLVVDRYHPGWNV